MCVCVPRELRAVIKKQFLQTCPSSHGFLHVFWPFLSSLNSLSLLFLHQMVPSIPFVHLHRLLDLLYRSLDVALDLRVEVSPGVACIPRMKFQHPMPKVKRYISCKAKTRKKRNMLTHFFCIGNSESSRSSISYVSELRLKAHDGQPLVLLEEFEDLLSKVACDDSGIALHFHDGADAEFAMGSWGRMGGSFVAISSHASGGCNSAIDREPHLFV